MNEHDCQACGEYYELSRRGFMKFSGATLLALGAPAWLPRIAMARDEDSTRDVLVSIYLRGGADGLTLCVPYGDAAYYSVRSHGTSIAPPDGTNLTAQALSTTTMFGLPPAMAALVTPFEDGKLAIVHATGWKVPNPSRSHFDAQRWMELGKFNDPTLFTGWLGRHLTNTGAVVPSDPVRAIGVANGLQAQLLGAPEAIPVPGLAGSSAPNFNLGGSTSTRLLRRKVLNGMYSAVAEPMKSAALITQQTIDLLNAIPFSSYAPAGGAAYPTTSFGYSLKSTAAILKNNMGVEAVAIDRSGWDTHSNQGVALGGSMYNTMKDVADALNAFYIDVVQNYNRNVVVVMMSEFGRRAADNATLGTDHGYGNAMFLMGNRINGRQVLSLGTNGLPGWPGLGPGQLFQNLDLNVTLDFRDILGEVCQNLLNDPDLSGPSGVFPGYVPTFRGITT
jgi:uncharacterized protein (DUF1501 family)